MWGEEMKKNLSQILALFLLLLSLGTVAIAGEIKGKVTAQHQKSAVDIAVYVDTIPGKTFTPPATGPVADQKHMTFQPHVIVVLKGTTVQFLNSDPVGHNVFWPNISGNKKLCAAALQRPPGNVGLRRCGTHSVLRRNGQGRQF